MKIALVGLSSWQTEADRTNFVHALRDLALYRAEDNDVEYLERGDHTDVAAVVSRAEVVIADLTLTSFDVSMAVGATEATKKPLIFIAESGATVPPSISRYRILYYPSKDLTDPGFLAAVHHALTEIRSGAESRPTSWESAPEKTKVFVSYARADKAYLDRLLVHLEPLQRDGVIDIWSDNRLTAGDQWRTEIAGGIERARIAILLISADFLASKFISTDELPPLLSRAETEGTRILVLITKACRFMRYPELSKFHAVNDPTTPLILMTEGEQEVVYDAVAQTIEDAVAGSQ